MYSRLVVNHCGFFIADVDFYRADKSSIILFNETYSG